MEIRTARELHQTIADLTDEVSRLTLELSLEKSAHATLRYNHSRMKKYQGDKIPSVSKGSLVLKYFTENNIESLPVGGTKLIARNFSLSKGRVDAIWQKYNKDKHHE